MNTADQDKALKTLNPRSVWLPVIFSLGIVTWVVLTDENITWESVQAMQEIAPGALLVTLLLLFCKDFFNMLRLRLLSGGEFSLGAAVYVVLLWEFAIAVTPPVIGATAVLIFIMFKEGLSLGKALAYTLLAAMMDNFFFLTASPLAIWFSDGAVLPSNTEVASSLGNSLSYFFWLSYGLIAWYTFQMSAAVLFFPKTIRRILTWLMSLKWLRKWQGAVVKQSKELELASKVLKGKKLSYWLSLIGCTYLVWAMKYAIVNALMAGFVPMGLAEHALALGRHVIMWVVMLVSPSPGNAGSAEIIFPAFYQDFLGEYTFITSLIWRMVTFYPYLLIGAVLLPRWTKRIFRRKELANS